MGVALKECSHFFLADASLCLRGIPHSHVHLSAAHDYNIPNSLATRLRLLSFMSTGCMHALFVLGLM